MAVSGTYEINMNTPMGSQSVTLTLKEEGGSLSGTFAGQMGSQEFSGGTVDGNKVKFDVNINAMGNQITLNVDGTIDGDSIAGMMNTPMGGAEFTGKRKG